MSVLLLVVLPLLVEGYQVEAPPSNEAICRLPPPPRERFENCSPAGNTWYVQYQYRVAGHFDLGCITFQLTQGKIANEMNLNASFSRVPALPMDGTIRTYGNRFQLVFNGIWNCAMSGPYNTVYCDEDFFVLNFCFLGQELSQIFTKDRKPSEKLMAKIWRIVENLPLVDKSKYVKAVC